MESHLNRDRLFSAQDDEIEVITHNEILRLLPHRGPSLMLDEARVIKKEHRIVATYYLSPQNPVFQGHYPQAPVLKGVLHVEIAALAGAILAKKMYPEIRGLPYLSGIGRVGFKRPAYPEDTLNILVHLMRHHRDNPQRHPFEFSFTITKKIGEYYKDVSSGSFEGKVVKQL